MAKGNERINGAGSSTKRQHADVKTDGVHTKLKCLDITTRKADALSTVPCSSDVLRKPNATCDDEYYPMQNSPCGVALIFNHENFMDRKDYYEVRRLPSRSGAQNDGNVLRETFQNLGFEVKYRDDLKHSEIRELLKTVSEQDHSKHDCIAVVVLSHGDRNGNLSAKDTEYPASELWAPFSANQCPSLEGKPKLFFIQACKGDDFKTVKVLRSSAQDVVDCMCDDTVVYPVPSYADILVSYSTFEDLKCKHSQYVQTLCAHLKDHGKDIDLVSLLIEVTRLMRQKICEGNKLAAREEDVLQIHSFTSSLRRRICFK